MKNTLFLLAIATIFSGCLPQRESPEKKLNVLFILADDLGAYDLSYANDEYYESPNIDRIAKSGVQFTNGYAGAQVCSPSRATIMTGKSTVAHGITDWIGAETGEQWGKRHTYTRLLPPAYHMRLDSADITLPELLRENGVKTFFAGKWHLGEKGSWPEDHGFDINKGGWDVGSPKGGYFSPFTNPNLENREDGENLSQRLAEETAQFIKANKDNQFFAFLSFYAVHGPIQTTENYWQKYRNKAVAAGLDSSGYQMEKRLPIRTVQDNPIYAGLIQHMDDAVGIVLNQLEALGLEENTIVVFTSDNGGVASGDAYSTSNAPLRGGKGYHWEGGIRVPYLIKVPGLEPKVVDYPVSGQDFYPTIAKLLDLAVPEAQKVDGMSLTKVLKGEKPKKRTLVWHYPHYGNQGGDPVSIVREGNFKLIYYWETKTSELYDLSADLGEQNDLSNDKTNMVTELEAKLFENLNMNQARFPEMNPYFSEEALAARMKAVTENWLPSLEERRLNMLKEDFKPNENWWGSTTD